jgi:aquaporin Z
MDKNLRANLAELFGSFLLVFFAAGTACAAHLTGDHQLESVGVALATGLTLAVVLTATFPVSPGCLNPALTLTFWVFKRLEGRRAAALIAMQLMGGVLAGLVIRKSFAESVLLSAHCGTPHLTPALTSEGVTTLSLLSGVGIEVLLTYLVTVAVFATLLDPRAPRLGGLIVGLAQAAVVLFGYRLTGGSANPARWFGPVVWELTLKPAGADGPGPLADHAVYWAGPALGALLGAFVYTAVLQSPEKDRT